MTVTLVIGAAASGKSAYAESLCLGHDGPRVYMATMEPFGEEGARRIARHRALREGKGFSTLERTRDVGAAVSGLPRGCTLLLEDVGNRVVRTISYTAEFDGEAREMCLYYTTKVGEDYSADRRVFPQSLGSGQYVYTLPRTSLAALRLDPCSPEENKAVTLTMSDITLNAADTLPAVWQYFVPTWYQAFCLVLYPALAAAAVSMVGAVVTERKRK